MAEATVQFRLDNGDIVCFEVDEDDAFHPASRDEAPTALDERLGPLAEAARNVASRFSEMGPDTLELSFGVKVKGSANWVIARASSEANFEVKLIWSNSSDGE